MTTRAAYDAAVVQLRQAYGALPPGVPVRLGKKTSNLFRVRTGTTQKLDVTAFEGVIGIDVEARTAEVLGMTTYEHLVDATLAHGLMPLVVPQLKSITLGGAVTGLGIESSSFRNGLPHESVLEMDVLTGAGEVLTVRPGDDLYAGFPNSYGTLGYALRLVVALEPTRRFVRLEHRPATGYAELALVLEKACDEDVAFVDGVAFTPDEGYVTVGTWADTAQDVSDYTLTEVYYRSLQTRSTDALTARDYLWRWDTDWFWCSRAFGVQDRPWLRRLLGRRLLRSTTWWKLVNLETRHGVKARLDRRRGRPAAEMVVQDIEVPVGRLAEFLAFLDTQTGIRPVWVCPLRSRPGSPEWPLYPLGGRQLWVNVGFWSTAPLPAGETDGFHNRRIEAEVTRLGGHKSLYSTAFYTPEEFASHYGGQTYDVLKKTYDPDGRLLSLYEKTVGRR